MKKLSTGFATPIIFAAVVLLVGIGIAFTYFQIKLKSASQPQTTTSQSTSSPTPITNSTPPTEETANWKTYRNQDWNFTLKYPSDWLQGTPKNDYYIPNMDIRSFSIIFGPATTTNHIGEKIAPTATTGVAVQIISADQTELDNFSSCISSQVNLKKSIIIDGKTASLFVDESLCGLGNSRDVAYVINNGKLYEITINAKGVTGQILSTFKFTN